jgi:GNAT superfamily N-acetyltransferase
VRVGARLGREREDAVGRGGAAGSCPGSGYRPGVSDADLPLVYRQATSGDAKDLIRLERTAQVLLADQGVDLRDLTVPDGIDEPSTWVWAVVAELDGHIVGMARLTELAPALLCLDQVSVDPRHAHRGVGRGLLLKVADDARALGYTAITGTTFRHVIFNGPFYESLGAVEDPEPHPVMIERRKVERAVGLDRFGPRVVLRLTL